MWCPKIPTSSRWRVAASRSTASCHSSLSFAGNSTLQRRYELSAEKYADLRMVKTYEIKDHVWRNKHAQMCLLVLAGLTHSHMSKSWSGLEACLASDLFEAETSHTVSVLMGNGRDPPRMTILVAKILEITINHGILGELLVCAQSRWLAWIKLPMKDQIFRGWTSISLNGSNLLVLPGSTVKLGGWPTNQRGHLLQCNHQRLRERWRMANGLWVSVPKNGAGNPQRKWRFIARKFIARFDYQRVSGFRFAAALQNWIVSNSVGMTKDFQVSFAGGFVELKWCLRSHIEKTVSPRAVLVEVVLHKTVVLHGYGTNARRVPKKIKWDCTVRTKVIGRDTEFELASKSHHLQRNPCCWCLDMIGAWGDLGVHFH